MFCLFQVIDSFFCMVSLLLKLSIECLRQFLYFSAQCFCVFHLFRWFPISLLHFSFC